MPVATSYTEASLAAFMVVELAGIGVFLGWVPGSPSVTEAVTDVELALGLADVATSTNIAAVRVLGCLTAWRRARGALVNRFANSEDGQSFHPEQMWDHADKMVTYYEQQAAALGVGGGGSVSILSVIRSEDPYAVATVTGSEF